MTTTVSSANSPYQYRSVKFLENHVRQILRFYYPQCIDTIAGGYFQHFLPDGSIAASNTQRHLVSSARLAINFASGAQWFSDPELKDAARHGIQYLREAHRNTETGGYAWMIENGNVVDADNYCYGFAFVLMAYARAYSSGIGEAKEYIQETFDLLEAKFWRSEDQLYVDVIDARFQSVSNYRGQNANMHCCEAMICAFEATSDQHYLDRAITIARRITVDLAEQCDGKIWEHYTQNWLADFEYNAGDTENKLRPWGFQPGHFTEWSKLLLIINHHSPEPWLTERAKTLFHSAMENGFDRDFGGLYYGIAPSGEVCSNGKYSWVQAETIAAAALLGSESRDNLYWCIYLQLWQYSIDNMVDADLKCWHRNLTFDNKIHDTSGTSMGRTDYHSIAACLEIARSLSQSKLP